MRLPRIHEIPLELIDDFPGHPYQVRMDEDMDQLVESIKERGIITPVTLRPKDDGRCAMSDNKKTNKLPVPGKVKKGFRFYVMTILALTLVMGMSVTAFAAGTGDPLTVVNNLSDFIFGLIRAVGLILLGWGIVQVGLSLQSHDPSQRSNGFLTLAGGIVITFAKEILTLITG